MSQFAGADLHHRHQVKEVAVATNQRTNASQQQQPQWTTPVRATKSRFPEYSPDQKHYLDIPGINHLPSPAPSSSVSNKVHKQRNNITHIQSFRMQEIGPGINNYPTQTNHTSRAPRNTTTTFPLYPLPKPTSITGDTTLVRPPTTNRPTTTPTTPETNDTTSTHSTKPLLFSLPPLPPLLPRLSKTHLCILYTLTTLTLLTTATLLVFWKLILPSLMQRVFAESQIVDGSQVFMGVTKLRVTEYLAGDVGGGGGGGGGVKMDMEVDKVGYQMPLGVSGRVGEGSRWVLSVSGNDSSEVVEWRTVAEIESFPAEMTLKGDRVTYNATDFEVLFPNSTVLAEFVKIVVGGGGGSEAINPELKMKLMMVVDVTVGGVFPVNGLVLENTFRVVDLVTGNGTSFVSQVTADPLNMSGGVVSTNVHLHIKNMDDDGVVNKGSPLQFPAFENVECSVLVSGKPTALLKVDEVGMTLGQKDVVLPVSLNRDLSSSANRALNSSAQLVGFLASGAYSAVFSKGQVSLVDWTIGSISSQNSSNSTNVPVWMQEVVGGLDVEFVAGSGGVFGGMMGQLLLQLF